MEVLALVAVIAVATYFLFFFVCTYLFLFIINKILINFFKLQVHGLRMWASYLAMALMVFFSRNNPLLSWFVNMASLLIIFPVVSLFSSKMISRYLETKLTKLGFRNIRMPGPDLLWYISLISLALVAIFFFFYYLTNGSMVIY